MYRSLLPGSRKTGHHLLIVTRERSDVLIRPGQQAMTRYGLSGRIFGSYEWKIHQLLARDPDFRSLCEEHVEARRAMEHFLALESSHPRITEYSNLIKELEEDILRELKRSVGGLKGD